MRSQVISRCSSPSAPPAIRGARCCGSAKEVYAALDWLGREQPFIEAKLAGRHLKDGALLLYDVTSIYRRAAVPVRRQRA